MASEFGVRQLDAALERRGLTRLSMKRPVKPGHGKAVSSHRSPNQNEDENGPNQASHATACTPRMKANVRPREIMKMMINIMVIVAGILMSLPVMLPWVRGLTEKGRHYYSPSAHADFIIVVGSRSVNADRLSVIAAVVGLGLILVGAFGLWRSMK